MFGLLTPITYNTDLNPILSHYYMGFCGGNCPSYASLFNPPWIYNNGVGIGNPYFRNSYQCNNFYPSIYALNYNTPIYFGGNYPAINTFQYVYPQTYINTNTTSSNNLTTATVVKTTTHTEVNNFAKNTRETTDFGKELVNTAKKYKNCSEIDGSHKKFCINATCKSEDPFNQEWCTDFVTYVARETYQNQGKTIPDGFGNHDVKELKNWAISENCFIRTSNKSQKGSFIANNIKPGDIMIINENGASHTGFVTSVDKKSGVIKTIEGNRDDMVKEYSYSPNYPDLSGFIRLAS